jgi:N-methylhydantoinase A
VLGVDIGGTFTDFVLLRDGRVTIHKLLSTPDDPARALLQGVARLGVPPALVHGTTAATNALLERRGAATALITTAGFADLLAIGRGDRPALYDLDQTRAPPLVPDPWRLEVIERLDHTGTVLTPIDQDALDRLVAWLAEQPVESVAICLLHSYANPAHEQVVVEALERDDRRPTTGDEQQMTGVASTRRWFVSASHQVLPEPREYERASTTVVNAYVAPVLGRYLARLETALAEQGVRSLRLMASDGGSMGLATAHTLAARATLSGPAGGIVGAHFVARRAGFERIITFDMGGTSTDVALVDGDLPRSPESQVGGLPVRLPSLDIHTVGAGGGSLARIDAGGALRVGPQSAGADPGPACYGKGTLPTVTDANLLLGRLQAHAFLGGRMVLDIACARAAFAGLAEAIGVQKRDLGGRGQERAKRSPEAPPPPLSDDVAGIEQAGLGVIQVANAAMERAIRAISVERGDDPRDFVLVAFGGAGPLHAAYLAEMLGMRRVLVPRFPGVLSALGMLAADVTRDAARSLLLPLAAIDPADLRRQIDELASEALDALAADGEDPARCRIDTALDLRYAGQSFEITVPFVDNDRPAGGHVTGQSSVAELAELFHTLHERRYGHAMRDRGVEAVLLRVRAVSARVAPELDRPQDLPPRPGPPAANAVVSAALAADSALATPAALYNRDDLRPGDRLAGPAIIAQFDATTIVPPAWVADVDGDGNLVLS